MFSVPNIELWA